jgi:hypothetical protein
MHEKKTKNVVEEYAACKWYLLKNKSYRYNMTCVDKFGLCMKQTEMNLYKYCDYFK